MKYKISPKLSLALVLTSTLSTPLFAQTGANESCTLWADFQTQASTQMLVDSAQSNSVFEINGQLIYRPLLIEEDHYWLGFQLYQPQASLDGEESQSLVYSVPFAVKVDAQSKRATDYIYNAPLEFADQGRLRGIHQALHINGPASDANPFDYLVEERDDIGEFESHYVFLSPQEVSKSKQAYTQTGWSTEGIGIAQISEVILHGDQMTFELDQCWYQQANGFSDLEVLTENNFMHLRVDQEVSLQQRLDSPPQDALLLQLPLDPNDWEMLPEEYVYPKAGPNPMDSGDQFLLVVSALNLTEIDSETIQQLLYDNQEYLYLLRAPLLNDVFSDANESRLFLMLGILDVPNSHELLGDVFLDENFDNQARFRTLMALKYSETPINYSVLEQIFFYASQDLIGSNSELAHSSMMVLGIVAGNQLDSGFGRQLSDRIALELRSTLKADKAAALLTALGNSGDSEQQFLVSDYLSNNDPLLRERSAQALEHMPSDSSLRALSTQLRTETNTNAQQAILQSMGSNQLDGSQLDQVYDYAKNSSDTEIRGAAISALVQQKENNPEVETELRDLLKTERNEGNMRDILSALYQ